MRLSSADEQESTVTTTLHKSASRHSSAVRRFKFVAKNDATKRNPNKTSNDIDSRSFCYANLSLMQFHRCRWTSAMCGIARISLYFLILFFSAGRICMCRNNWTQMNGLHWLHGRIELMRLWQLRTIEWKTWFIGKFPPFVHWPIDEFSIDLKWELKFGKIDCINWCHEKFFQSIKSQIFFAIKVW